jgi:hypothetical protein
VAGNDFEHALEIAEDLVVPEAKDPVALLGKKGRALRVGIALGRMLTTVELDDQPFLRAAEVDEEWTNRMLATELEAPETAITKTRPESTLALGLGAPQPASEVSRWQSRAK